MAELKHDYMAVWELHTRGGESEGSGDCWTLAVNPERVSPETRKV